MDKAKIQEYFNATTKVVAPVHIIGCGAIGSHIAEQLTRIGCTNIHLWDFDTVSSHNITNQLFRQVDVGCKKTDAIWDHMVDINPEIRDHLTIHPFGWDGQTLEGYVFLCVDNIDLRRKIVEKNEYNPEVIAFFDFRMRLTDAQHYMAERHDFGQMKDLLDSMNFSHEEAKDATPKSACGTELSVIYTVKAITAIGIANFVKLCLGLPTKQKVFLDLKQFTLDAYPMD